MSGTYDDGMKRTTFGVEIVYIFGCFAFERRELEDLPILAYKLYCMEHSFFLS